MTDILCRWLSKELGISLSDDPATFAREFSSGYLFGEILYKYKLQDDFELFSQSRTPKSKLNNFSRLERVFRQLGVPFNVTVARDVMTEKHGMAARLMYHLYIVLHHQQQKMATLRQHHLQASVDFNNSTRLNIIEESKHRERMKKQKNTGQQPGEGTQGDVRPADGTPFQDRFLSAEQQRRAQEQAHLEALERERIMKTKQSEMVAKIRSSTIPSPRPPSKSNRLLQERQAQRRKREASETVAAISRFEDKLKMILLPTDDGNDDIDISYILKRDEDRTDTLNVLKLSSNSEYIGKIRKRLQEDYVAREEREKRRRKVIGEQLSAHQAQEEAHREEMMVNKLMRQSQQERRIAVQLLQARKEKSIIRNNRIRAEKQYQERRLQEFEKALDQEATLAQQQRDENKEELQQAQKLHDQIAAQRAEERYRNHYSSCYDIVAQVVDFSCKIAEYRQLTENLIPAKLMRDWTATFVSGYPLYESVPLESGEPTPEQILEEERQMLLDEGDFMEYKNMIGEWQPPDSTEMTGPPRSNRVVGHIIQRLYSIVHPPTPPPPPPEFPSFPLRACVLGKPFSGKTTAVRKLLEEHRLVILDTDELVNVALKAHKNNELMEDHMDPVMREMSATDQPSANQDEEVVTETGSVVEAGAGSDLTAVIEEGQVSEKSSDGQVRRQESKESKDKDVKPSSVQKSRDKVRDPNESQPSLRNKLGSKALKFLKKGRPVDDQIMVDILADAIRHVPEGTGWVIDGYPQNYNQAKALEKALTGYDANKDVQKQALKSKRKPSMVSDLRPTPPPPPEPSSGIDVVILFDVDDDVCIRRANEQPKNSERELGGSTEEPPVPTEGSTSATGKASSVSDVVDPDQLQHRLVSFQDSWPKMDKWFTRFGTLKKVDATEQPEALFLEMEKIMEDTVAKILGKDIESSLPLEETETEKAEETPEVAPVETTDAPKDDAAGSRGEDKQPTSKDTNRVGSARHSSKASEGTLKDADRRKSMAAKPDSAGKKSDGKRGSKASPIPVEKGSKKGKKDQPLPEVDFELEESLKLKTPQPGDEEWEYINTELDPTLASILSAQWEGVETTYVANCKHVFRQVRQERENIYRYFFQVRKDFLLYLRQPDHKQDLVEMWQESYNSVPNDMRNDDQTKAELHQRVDDLRQRLWTVCDERKEQAEAERMAIMTDGWLDDRLGLLINHYITVMQAELDRFQDTCRLLKDYYKAMDDKQIPDELITIYSRIPLMDMPMEKPESTKNDGEGGPSVPCSPDLEAANQPDRGRSPQPDDTSIKDNETPETHVVTTPLIPVVRIKIPLVPRLGEMPEPEVYSPRIPEKHHDQKKQGKKTKVVEPEPRGGGYDRERVRMGPAPHDPDEKFLFEAIKFALKAIVNIVSEETALKQEEEAALMALEMAEQKPKAKKKKEAPIELSEEEKQGRELKKKIRTERYFTVKEEETAARTRLDLVKMISMAVVQDLKHKADSAFKDMNDWLGERFLKEMKSIDTMSEVMRQAIEEGLPLKESIILEQEDFLIETELEMLKTPSPLPVPDPGEEPMAEHFTVKQLFRLFKQLRDLAPGGVLSVKAFIEVMENTVSVGASTDLLPDLWLGITPQVIEVIARSLALDSEQVDWRRFLRALMWPIPLPTQSQLLQALANFRDMDQRNLGLVTREQYDRTALWFDTQSLYATTFDRLTSLKKILFDIFADHSGSLSKLDYKNFLLYFCEVPNYYEGFLRALSVMTGQHMPRLPKPGAFSNLDLSSGSIEASVSESTGSHIQLHAQGMSSLNLESIEEVVQTSLDPPMMDEKVPMAAIDSLVSPEHFHKVVHHGKHYDGDSHRFSISDPVEKISMEKLLSVYEELGGGTIAPMTLKNLMKHPIIQETVLACRAFTSVDVEHILDCADEQ